MPETYLRRLQKWFVVGPPERTILTVLGLCLAAGLLGGAYIALLSPLYAAGLTAALVLGLLALHNIEWGYYALIGIICLLPFAALPMDIGFTPTFLDGALLLVFGVWFLGIVGGQYAAFRATSLGLPLTVFLILACASFAAGLAHAQLTANVVRHFAELLLGISLYFAVVNTVQTPAQLQRIVRVLILAGTAAASLGVVLNVIPEAWTVRALSSLGRFHYPVGLSVLRYVEDNPELARRATSTSIDPNVLGGLMILVTSLTAAQLFARRPLLPRPIISGGVAAMTLCLYMTYSRGSLLGLSIALGLLGMVKYRRLLLVALAAALLMLVLPQAQYYVTHLMEGLQGQDLATKMRLGEYKDAFILIGRYPWFGVGFAGSPDIDTYIGVSSVYLLMAEEMGLVGVAVFLIIMGNFFGTLWIGWRRAVTGSELESILLGLATAVAGILVGGIFDHYFFNLNFPHSVSLFWLYVGMGMVAARLITAESNKQ